MINGPFRVDGKQVQCAFSVLIFSHTTTFSRDSNLGHKNNSFAWGTAGGLCSSVALEDSMHFRKCCHGGPWAPVVFGKVGISGKSKGDIFNRRLIFFHLHSKRLIPKAVFKSKTQQVRGDEAPRQTLLLK